MADPELGTKRTCPETGKNFYDLNKDPIVSPYTGQSYPISFFEAEQAKPKKAPKEAEKPDPEDDEDEDEEELEAAAGAALVLVALSLLLFWICDRGGRIGADV